VHSCTRLGVKKVTSNQLASLHIHAAIVLDS